MKWKYIDSTSASPSKKIYVGKGKTVKAVTISMETCSILGLVDDATETAMKLHQRLFLMADEFICTLV